MSKRANRRTEIEIDASGKVAVRSGGTLTGEAETAVAEQTMQPHKALTTTQPRGNNACGGGADGGECGGADAAAAGR